LPSPHATHKSQFSVAQLLGHRAQRTKEGREPGAPGTPSGCVVLPTIQLTAQVGRTTLGPEADLVMQTETAAEPVRLQSRVRRLHHRAIGFAAVIACAAVLAGACFFYAFEIHLPAADLRERNRKTLDRVACIDKVCDITRIANDYEFLGPDYLVDKNTRFLLNFMPSVSSNAR
jgi:hypothetical protein